MQTVVIYRDRTRAWRWRLLAGNHRIIAHGGEGYQRKGSVSSLVYRLFPHARFRYEIGKG